MTKIKIRHNFPLKNFTTFKIGGPAKYFTAIKKEAQLIKAVSFAKTNKLPIFILGGGSNILISDKGFPGLVIANQIKGIKIQNYTGKALLTAGAGKNWDQLVKIAVKNKLAGIEALSGVPGNAGATPVQNIGCYGQSLDQVLYQVRVFDLTTSRFIDLANSDCRFGYRDSIFKSRPGKYIITQISLELKQNGKPIVSSYHDLQNYFAGKSQSPTLKEFRKAVLEIRAKKGMVIMPEYESYKSVGSFFKNPIVPQNKFKTVRKLVKTSCVDPWFWKLPSGKVKISAACLMQQAGFKKGYQIGPVGISPKHPLALINYRSAKSSDMVALARFIQKEVRKKFNILLEPEVGFIGFENHPLLV